MSAGLAKSLQYPGEHFTSFFRGRGYLHGMNMHVSLDKGAAGFGSGSKRRFKPRCDILNEVVAGLIWIQLDLPENVSRSELETFAYRLVQRILANASIHAVEDELTFLQRDQFCRPAKVEVIRQLARRTMSAVKGLPV
jgi:hypothetical protein